MSTSDSDTNEIPESDALLDESTGAEDAGAEEAGEEESPELSLEVSVDSPSACQRHVTVTIAQEDVDRYFSNQFDELMPKAEVPGFRPGHAPRKIVEKRFRPQVEDQVKGNLLMDAMTQVSEEQEFSAISEPDFEFDAVEIPESGPLSFEFDIEVRPEFDMPNWKGLKIERPAREFTDEDVDKHLQNILSRSGDLVPTEDAASADDYITANLTFRHGGEKVSTVEEETIRVRPKLSFPDGSLEGFDKLVVGAKGGDKREAKITISTDAENEDLRGEDVDVEIEILDVKKLEVPELDEELLQKLGGFSDEEKLREAVKGELERQLNYRQQRQVRGQITELLTESAEWELPPDLLKRQSSREFERAVMELQSSGFGADEIRAHENELRQNSMASTSAALKEHFILERIAEEENIEDTPEDYDREIMMIALSQQDSPRRVRARLEKRGQMDTLRNQIIERKAIELITEEADFVDVDFEMEEMESSAVDHWIGGAPGSEEIPEVTSTGPATDALPGKDKKDK